MADVNKSVQISYRADLKQLIQQLKQMPGITDTEAKKMVGALDRQFKRAEASAKRAASKQARALSSVSVAASKSAVSVEHLGDQAGDLDRAFMGAAQAANMFSPALGSTVMLASDGAAIFEAVTLGLTKLNPAFLALAGVVGTVVSVMGFLNSETEKQQKLAENLRSVQKQRADALAELAAIATTVTDNLEQARIENRLLSGEITEGEAERLRITKETKRETEAQTQQVYERIRANNQLLQLLEIAETRGRDLTETEKEQLNLAQLRLRTQNRTTDIEAGGVQGDVARLSLRAAINAEIEKENKFIDRTIEAGEKILNLRLENLELTELQADREEILAAGEEKKEARQQRAKDTAERLKQLQDELNAAIYAGLEPVEQINAKYDAQIEKIKQQADEFSKNAELQTKLNKAVLAIEKERADALQSITDEQQKEIDEANKKRADAIEQLKKHTISAEESKLDAVKRRYHEELKQIAKLEMESGDYDLASQAREQARLNAIFEREEILAELNEEELKRIEARDAALQGSALDVVSSLEALARATMKYYDEADQGNSQTAAKMFKIQKALALTSIAMNTAAAVMTALRDLGPVAGTFASVGILATGAAQAVEVQGQQAPSFHMGGLVSQVDPDERQATVLQGEAVLDRGTVSRLGAQGIRNLQAGQDMAATMVISPWKHFDRFLNSELRRPSRLRAAIGQRGTLGAY